MQLKISVAHLSVWVKQSRMFSGMFIAAFFMLIGVVVFTVLQKA